MEIISPHHARSREITDADIERVASETQEMLRLVNEPIGMYPAGYALAHSQITDEDPLRFFVTNPNYEQIRSGNIPTVIINPVIINHTNQVIDKDEGCLSFAKLPMVKTQRWNKITVNFKWLDSNKKLNTVMAEKYSGMIAQIFQHECDHLDGKYIYPFK